MKYTYDPIADAINITLKDGKVAKTREVAPGILIDLDRKGDPLHLEILDVSKRFPKQPLHGVEFQPFHYSKLELKTLTSS